MSKIGFIGGGNMAKSLIGGMLAHDFNAADIAVLEPDANARADLKARFGINCSEDAAILQQSAAIILAVKPQVIGTALENARAHFQSALLISIAAGITLQSIGARLPASTAMVRAMPNTPALIGMGATGLFANAQVSAAERQLSERILGAVGRCAWLADEQALDAITALSGSGPAYIFAFLEAMIQSGSALGLPADLCREFAVQTALGAAQMASQSEEDIATLRTNVTSKGGTTAAALAAFENGDLNQLVATAMHAAYTRSQELAAQLS